MTTITTVFTGDYNDIKTQLGEYIDLLFTLAKGGNSTGELRLRAFSIADSIRRPYGRYAVQDEEHRVPYRKPTTGNRLLSRTYHAEGTGHDRDGRK